MGSTVTRLDGPAKVTGTAPYAFEFGVENPVYLHPVQSTIARGRITAMDTSAAQAVDGVTAVLTVFDAPRLADTSNGDLAVLQDSAVHYRGQLIGGVIADSAETARHAAHLWCASITTSASRHRTDRRPPRALHPRTGQPGRTRPRPLRRCRGRAARGGRRRRQDLHHPARAQQPDGTARPIAMWDTRRADPVGLHPGCARRARRSPRRSGSTRQVRVVAK